MFGTSLIGNLLYGTGKDILESAFSGIFSYNGYSFESDNITIGNIPDIDNLGTISNFKYKTARQDGMGYVSQTIDSRTITISGTLKASSGSELIQIMGAMKRSLYEPNKTLFIKRDTGDIWETMASCTVANFDRQHYTIDRVPFTFVFEVIDPFFYWQALQEKSFLAQSNSFTSTVENLVGQRKSYPNIRLQFGTWLSSVTSITVVVGQSTIGITWTFTDSDIVEIDCKSKDVLLNSVWEQEYTWGFGVLEIGSNDIEIAVDGIWSADIYFERYPTYG